MEDYRTVFQQVGMHVIQLKSEDVEVQSGRNLNNAPLQTCHEDEHTMGTAGCIANEKPDGGAMRGRAACMGGMRTMYGGM